MVRRGGCRLAGELQLRSGKHLAGMVCICSAVGLNSAWVLVSCVVCIMETIMLSDLLHRLQSCMGQPFQGLAEAKQRSSAGDGAECGRACS